MCGKTSASASPGCPQKTNKSCIIATKNHGILCWKLSCLIYFCIPFLRGARASIWMPWSMTSRMCWGVSLSCRSQKVYRYPELSCIYVEWNNTTHWMRKIQELMEGQACQNYVKNAFRCVYLTIKKNKFSRYLQVLVVTFLPPIMRMNTTCKLANSP